MKKFLFVLAAMTAVTVSCNTKIESETPKEEKVAVDFSAYLNRGVAS